MCKYCDGGSKESCIFIDPLTNDYYLNIRTDEFDLLEDDWVYIREYINYCPWCGCDLGLSDYQKQLKLIYEKRR